MPGPCLSQQHPFLSLPLFPFCLWICLARALGSGIFARLSQFLPSPASWGWDLLTPRQAQQMLGPSLCPGHSTDAHQHYGAYILPRDLLLPADIQGQGTASLKNSRVTCLICSQQVPLCL